MKHGEEAFEVEPYMSTTDCSTVAVLAGDRIRRSPLMSLVTRDRTALHSTTILQYCYNVPSRSGALIHSNGAL